MDKKSEKIRLKRVFGLVSAANAALGRILMLSRSQTPLEPVLALLTQDKDDRSIHAACPGIRPEEIRTARAYHARFGADVNSPAPLPEGPKALLLDECFPLTLLPYVQRTFGFSSHVEAEGWSLGNRDNRPGLARKKVDSGIAGFAFKQNFTGLVTRDTDFRALSQNPDNDASHIHIFLLNVHGSREELESCLHQNRALIQTSLRSREPRLHILA